MQMWARDKHNAPFFKPAAMPAMFRGYEIAHEADKTHAPRKQRQGACC